MTDETPEIEAFSGDDINSDQTMLRKVLDALKFPPQAFGTVYNGPKQRNDGFDQTRIDRAAAKRARRAR